MTTEWVPYNERDELARAVAMQDELLEQVNHLKTAMGNAVCSLEDGCDSAYAVQILEDALSGDPAQTGQKK